MIFLKVHLPEACTGYDVIIPTVIAVCHHLLFLMSLVFPHLESYISTSQKHLDLQSSQLAALTQNQGILYKCG